MGHGGPQGRGHSGVSSSELLPGAAAHWRVRVGYSPAWRERSCSQQPVGIEAGQVRNQKGTHMPTVHMCALLSTLTFILI